MTERGACLPGAVDVGRLDAKVVAVFRKDTPESPARCQLSTHSIHYPYPNRDRKAYPKSPFCDLVFRRLHLNPCRNLLNLEIMKNNVNATNTQ